MAPRTEVDAAYGALVEAMSPAERVRRAEELFRWSRDCIVRQLAAAGPLSDVALERKLALRLYGADPRFRELIEGLTGRDPR